ncbi:MAG: Crp/Fnr family transcriptional regulator [Polymorphobacter sp.]|uniref:Crp/Fnr family transcriptional regulator n=1 Tax=Polymorphobacter sp. TaxID=1909290 RepID=UPI003A876A73
METGLCSGCEVRDIALCSTLSEPDRAALKAISHHRHFEKGAVVMWAGDEAVSCGTLVSGLLELSASARDGRKQIFGLLYPSDFVGQPDAGLMPFSVTALTDCRLCLYPRAAFESVLDNHIAMERMLLRRTMAALDSARSRMLLLSRGTAAEKLAGFLLEMADRIGEPQASHIVIDLPLSRGQIADLLGLTIETVSRQMTHFRAAGHIELPGGRALIIRNRTALSACTIDAA